METNRPPHWGIETDLMLLRQDAIVTETDGYRIARSPANPGFYFGNLLVLDAPPSNADQARLEADFDRLVGFDPAIQHKTFAWPAYDAEPTDVSAFVDAGYVYDEATVLIAEPGDLMTPRTPTLAVEIRPFQTDDDWQAWHALKMADNTVHSAEGYRCYLLGREATYRRLHAAGQGNYWGAYIEGEQVAHLGLFFDARVGRYQSVLTAEAYRGHNLCRALVHAAARDGFQHADRLVMVADAHYHAARIYESVGFKPRERMASLCWWPKNAA